MDVIAIFGIALRKRDKHHKNLFSQIYEEKKFQDQSQFSSGWWEINEGKRYLKLREKYSPGWMGEWM